MENLEVAVEELDKLKLRLTVTVPVESVQNEYDKAYRSIKNKVKLPGFRPGKVPKGIVEKRFQSYMRQEALDKLVPEYLDKALKKEKINLAFKPTIEELEVEKSKPLVFKALAEIWPEIELPEATSFKLTKQAVEVKPEEIEEQRQKHLDRAATFEVRKKKAAKGDQVVIDFEGHSEEGPIGRDEDFEYEIGSKQFLPEVEKQLVGMKAGEEKEFDITLPADVQQQKFRGKEAKFKVIVKEVRSKKAPKIDEKFLKQYGEEVKTEEDFDNYVKEELTKMKEYENQNQYREAIKEQLKEKLTFDLPESPLKEEIEFQLKSAQKKERSAEIDEAELKTEAENRAHHLLRLALFIDKFMEKEDLKVNEQEVQKRFALNSQMLGMNPKELFDQEYGKKFFEDTFQLIKEETVLDHISQKVLNS